jgi:hypothetical protein
MVLFVVADLCLLAHIIHEGDRKAALEGFLKEKKSEGSGREAENKPQDSSFWQQACEKGLQDRVWAHLSR